MKKLRTTGALAAVVIAVVSGACADPPVKSASPVKVTSPLALAKITASARTRSVAHVARWRMYVGYTQTTVLGFGKDGKPRGAVRLRREGDGSITVELLTKHHGVARMHNDGTAVANDLTKVEKRFLRAVFGDLAAAKKSPFTSGIAEGEECTPWEWMLITVGCGLTVVDCLGAETGIAIPLCIKGTLDCGVGIGECLHRLPTYPPPDVFADSCAGPSPPKACPKDAATEEKEKNAEPARSNDPAAGSDDGDKTGDPKAEGGDPASGAAPNDAADAEPLDSDAPGSADPSATDPDAEPAPSSSSSSSDDGASADDTATTGDTTTEDPPPDQASAPADDEPVATDEPDFGDPELASDDSGSTVDDAIDAVAGPLGGARVSCPRSTLQCGVRSGGAYCRCVPYRR